VKAHLKFLFPKLVGYPRFVQMISEIFFPMFWFIKEHQGIATVLTVCHVKRAPSHKVFKVQQSGVKPRSGGFLVLSST